MGEATAASGADVEGVGVVGGSSIIAMSGCRSNRGDCLLLYGLIFNGI